MTRYTVELATSDESRLAILAQVRHRICALEFHAHGVCKQIGTAHQFRLHPKDGKNVLACTVEVDQASWEMLWADMQDGASFYVDNLFVIGPLP